MTTRLPGGRCEDHRRDHSRHVSKLRGSPSSRGYDHAFLKLKRSMVAAWIAQHGLACPGWQRPAHPVRSATDLSLDHILPLVAGGTNDPRNLTILCRSCNASKGARRRTFLEHNRPPAEWEDPT